MLFCDYRLSRVPCAYWNNSLDCLLCQSFFFNHYTDSHHFGFDSAIWYWHFVDVVWLFLLISVYWWSNY